MIRLNGYEVTLHSRTEFFVELTDDNNVIKIGSSYILSLLDKINLYVIEDTDAKVHVNYFKLVKAGEQISEYEDWIYIDSIGDLFLFQRRNWEGGE